MIFNVCFSDVEMERNRVTNDLTDAEVENAFDQILNETGGNNLAQSPGGNFFFDTFTLSTIRSSKMYS